DELVEYGRLLLSLGVDHANISNIHPVGSAFYSFRWLAPPLDQAQKPVRELVRSLLAERLTVTLEGFPFCTVGPYVDLQLEKERRDVPLLWKGKVLENYDTFMDTLRTKNQGCSECK